MNVQSMITFTFHKKVNLEATVLLQLQDVSFLRYQPQQAERLLTNSVCCVLLLQM